MLNSFILMASIATSNPNEAVFKLQEGNRLLNEGKIEQSSSLINSLYFYPYEPLKKFQNILIGRTVLIQSPGDAITLLQSAQIKGSSWYTGARYGEAWGWILQGQNDKALGLLQVDGNTRELQLLKAKLLLALDEPEEGLSTLETLDDLEEQWSDPTEILLVKALLLKEKGDLDQAIELLQDADIENVNGYFQDYLYLVLGKLYFEHSLFDKAQEQWNLLLQKFPHSSFRPDALYWTARILEHTNGDPKEVAAMHRDISLKYPDFSYADEVYFNQYSFKDYLQGEKDAMNHLDRFPSLYPNSPLAIVAHYLIAIDKEQERRSAEGKLLRKKNIKEALTSLEKVQNTYTSLKPDDPYYLHVKNLAALERGRLYREISNEATGPKKDIHHRYAIDVLSPLVNEEREISTKAVLLLAQLWMDEGDLEQAKLTVSKELEKWEGEKNSAVVALNTTQGEIFEKQRDFEMAWQYYVKAEEVGKDHSLSHDQELDLWIRQALCYQELQQYDQAMLLFSKAINRNVVSSHRLRAMYLRAEVYRKQGREELAKKQWEAVAMKGGEWGLRAKQKLEEQREQEE